MPGTFSQKMTKDDGNFCKNEEKRQKTANIFAFSQAQWHLRCLALIFSAGLCIQNRTNDFPNKTKDDKATIINASQQHCFPVTIFPFNVAQQ